MEQKRTLWIIVAAGVFLLFVLGAACILYSSPTKGNNPPSVARSASNNNPSQSTNAMWTPPASESSSINLISPTDQTSEILPPSVQDGAHVNELTVHSDNTVIYDLGKNTSSGTTIDLNVLRTATESQEKVPEVGNPATVTKIAETESASKTAEAPVPPTVEPKTVDVAKKTVPATENKQVPTTEKKVASAPAKTTTTAPAKTTSSTTAKKEAPTKDADVAKVVEKKAEQYWVQAAAFSTKKTAENARTVLDDNKIPADIFTYKDDEGKIYYRVRIGPYTTKSEAEYWRNRIVKIDEFANGGSYVTAN